MSATAKSPAERQQEALQDASNILDQAQKLAGLFGEMADEPVSREISNGLYSIESLIAFAKHKLDAVAGSVLRLTLNEEEAHD
jgi:hypothetical protein